MDLTCRLRAVQDHSDSIMVWAIFFSAVFEIFGAGTSIPQCDSVCEVSIHLYFIVIHLEMECSIKVTATLICLDYLLSDLMSNFCPWDAWGSKSVCKNLWTAEADIWLIIPVKRFCELVEFMPRRVAAFIKATVGSTRY
ncbi:hypothetical protein TNCV_4117771 [Trichonephila clavipes]|nr:hypothetical protein TNCV_4117771 [Trichonephila clavipes]